jgi:hypothetical protein
VTPHTIHSKPHKPKQAKQNPDSKTFDVRHISVHDDRLTVRINGQLKQAFLGHCRAKGLSCCHILEGVIYGYLQGFYDKFELGVKSPTINLTVVRDVKRVRRYAVEEITETATKTFADRVLDKKAEELNKAFAGAAEQWGIHSVEWRRRWIVRARAHPQLSNSGLVLAFEGECE